MKLDNVTAEIRPRGRWESVDLGVALTQKNFKSIMQAWALTVMPMMAIMLGLTYLWYAAHESWYNLENFGLFNFLGVIFPFFIVWWLKPIYERVPLYILSRSLFGEKVSVPQLVAQWPRMVFKDWFKLLVTRRISMIRSFAMPVHELEGLKGFKYSQRVSLLSRHGGDGASGLTISCAVIAHISLLTTYIAYRWLTMYGFDVEAMGDQVRYFGDALLSQYMDESAIPSLLFFLFSYMIVLTLLTPFYCGAGFAIYINSRTVSEGWDIELAFKRMTERLQAGRKGSSHTLLSFAFALFTFFAITDQVKAAEKSPEDEVAEWVMDNEKFDVTIVEFETPVDNSTDDLGEITVSDSGWGSFGTLLFYVLLVAGLVVLGVMIAQNLHIFRAGRPAAVAAVDDQVRARSVLGMDVTPESLPSDVLAAARSAWMVGDKKLALSLLYRGSLEWMVNSARLPIMESDTEQDCVRHTEQLENKPAANYFSRLTQLWVSQAYGKVEPEDRAIEWLCSDWPFAKPQQSQGGSVE